MVLAAASEVAAGKTLTGDDPTKRRMVETLSDETLMLIVELEPLDESLILFA